MAHSAGSRLFSGRRFQSSGGSGNSFWLNNMFAVQALEDTMTDNFDVHLEPEPAEEVKETSDLGAAAEDRAMPLAYNLPRHVESIRGPDKGEAGQSWRTKERMKTVSVALVICLNVGVDPPDVTKTQPCSRMECWIDPTTLNPQKAIEAIGNSLQQQYTRWQPRARYRQSLDPPLEEIRRLATSLRRNAREERVLFHYNGHGVPKPTSNGEIWVFNRNYTQYIPLSLYELQSWMGSPSIYVYDCSNAGIIVTAFEQFAEKHEREYLEQVNSKGVSSAELQPPVTSRSCIQLAACSGTQILPMYPELPADLFTSCLTTPIKMALRWFVMQKHSMLATNVTIDMLEKIPGQFGDRRTMLGEFNWIFTAITDTIAWNRLPRELFQKLFRQDMLVASLFRNFLLAERIMRSYDCTPISSPSLPMTHQHPMWQCWDLAVDSSLSQLKGILEENKQYKSSTFFEEQLTAFEIWLKYGDKDRPPPEQLPIVLQVLLSQAHRLRALDLFGRFLDLGPWAVNLALSVGIFPYVLKLLTSSARELRPLLVTIWAKILAVDPTCQVDLINNNSHVYFLNILQDECMLAVQRTWATFILATLVNNYPEGQQKAEKENLISACLEHIEAKQEVFRQWLAIALGRVWDHFEKAKWRGVRDNAHEELYKLLKDPYPEVRAAAVFALGTFLNSCEERTEQANSLDTSVCLHLLNLCVHDGSPLVRRELIVALQHYAYIFEASMITVVRMYLEGQQLQAASRATYHLSPNSSSSNLLDSPMTSMVGSGLRRVASSASSPALDRLGASGGSSTLVSNSSFIYPSSVSNSGSVYSRVWSALNYLASDPEPEVAAMAESLVIYFKLKAKEKERPSINRIDSIHETSSVPSSPVQRPSFMIGTSPPPPDLSLSAMKSNAAAQQKQPTESQGAVPRSQPQQDTSGAGRATTLQSQRNTPPPAQSSGHASLPSSGSSHSSGVQPVPGGSVRSRSANPSPNTTLGTVRDLRAPNLGTEFLAWSAKYFTQELMRHKCTNCDCDHESQRHWNREWLYKRNLDVRSIAEEQRDVLKTRICKVDEHVASFKTTFSPRTVVFHPYDAQLAVAGSKQITIQYLDSKQTLCTIKALNEKRHFSSQFTSLAYINAHEQALLLAGSDDGAIRIYRDVENEKEEDGTFKIKLISAWTALPGMVPNKALGQGQSLYQSAGKNSSGQLHQHMGMFLSWQQKLRLLAVGGDASIIRLWDAEKEMKTQDIKIREGATFVSALNFAATAGSSMLSAGFGDGAIQIYDIRLREPEVFGHQQLRSPILDVQLQDSGGFYGQAVFGSKDGSVRVLDLRKGRSVRELALGQELVALSIHKRAVALAAWTKSQYVTVHSLLGNGPQLNVIKNQEGILGHRAGPVGCLSFHPHLLQLATGPSDGNVAVYNLRKTV